MQNNQERELKMMISQNEYLELISRLPIQETIHQTNTYYDDDQFSLREKRIGLRIRNLKDKNIITIKKPKDNITKWEYEKETNADNPEEFIAEDWNFLNDHMNIPSELKPFVSFSTTRNIIDFPQAQLCIDQTQFGNCTDFEIEYEYRSDHDGIVALNSILKPFGLKYEKNGPSKLTRAIQYEQISSH